jgi:aminoglycoside 3-N-acetyltransferase
MPGSAPFVTRAVLHADLVRLGVAANDTVMVHAAMSRVGRILGGPDALVGALVDATTPGGTVLAYTDWDAGYSELLDADGRVPPRWRAHVPPFDPAASRSARDNGVLPEFLRTTPGALRSNNPGASVAALGSRAAELTVDHPLDYGYGEASPLARLVALGGKVLMVGAPLDTMTLLHHAEHLARIPGKRTIRYEVPLTGPGRAIDWRMVEEFDTADPVVDGLPDDYFGDIVTTFLDTGHGIRGAVGAAPSVLVDAAAITTFAVEWLESRPAHQPAHNHRQ